MSVEIRNLCKAFGSKEVLRNVNMTLEDGGIYCLMGPSGLGKTTLLRIIMGLETKDAGEILGIRPDREISAMFQEDRLMPTLTAAENVNLMYETKRPLWQIRQDLARILPEECLRQPVSELSGGMKRRVALARTVHFQGKMMILDEPFTGLDHRTKEEVIAYILKNRRNRILLVATHGLDDAKLLGAQVIQLSECQDIPGRYDMPDRWENGGDSDRQEAARGMDRENTRETDWPENARNAGRREMNQPENARNAGRQETVWDADEDPEEDAWEEEVTLTPQKAFTNLELFRGISEIGQMELMEALNGQQKEYGAGDLIWRQREEISCIGIILSGIVEARDRSEENPLIIRQFKAGECFGEAIAFGEHESLVEVRAVKPSRVLFLDMKRLLEKNEDPQAVLSRNINRTFATKIATLNRKLKVLREPSVRKRILMYLSIIPENARGEKWMDFSQKELSMYLNVHKDSINRELKRMVQDGILEKKGRKLRVLQENKESKKADTGQSRRQRGNDEIFWN